ncbi:MAG: DUF4912 domain-containing protein [Spirulina sp.]
MDKLPKPSLFVLSLIGALVLGPGPLMNNGSESVQAAVLGASSGWTRLVAQSPGTVPADEPVAPEAEAMVPLALSPDSQYMVRGTETGDLEWLDDQGRVTNRRISPAHQGPVLAVVITKDGQTVISAGADGTLRRWDRQGNTLGEATAVSGSTLVALALSPDGQTLIGGRADGLVEQWAVATGVAQGDPIAAHAAAIQTLNYMAGGQNWISGSQDGSLALWNADGSAAGQVASAHSGGVTQVASSPDGQVIATTGGDGTLRFWDRVTFQPRGETLAAHAAPIRAAAYSPDGSTLATAAADGTLRLWNADGTSRWPEPVALEGDPHFLGFTPAGDLVTGYADGRVERRGPQGDLIVVTSPQPPADGAQPWDSLGPLQRLPQNTWWILAAIPTLLILAGIVGALLGSNRSSETTDEALPTPEDGPYPDAVVAAEDAEDAMAAVSSVSPIDTSPDIPKANLDLSSEMAVAAAVPAAVPATPLTDAPLPPEADLDWSDAVLDTEAPGPGLNAPATMDPLPPEADLLPAQELVPQPPTSKLEQARADLAEGRKGLRSAQYEAGLLCFNSAIEATEVERMKAETLGTPLGGINALATQAHTQRGHALGLMDQPGEAMESYNTALALDGTAVEAWIGKGRLLIGLGRYEEALFCFDSALEIDSGLGPAWAGKGQALLRLGRHAEGQTCHQRAMALGPESLGPLPPYPTLDPASLDLSKTTLSPMWPGGEIVEPADTVDQGFDDDSDGGYDPDIPLDLQRVVMGLPSADTDLAYAFPSDYGVPPELAAEAEQLPSQAETIPPNGVAWAVESAEPGLSPDPNLGTAPWIRPAPSEVDPEPNAALADGEPPAHGITPMYGGAIEDDLDLDLSVEANWNPAQGWPTPKATAMDPSALATPDPDPTVPDAPGDFDPPAELMEDWPQDLPPEVMAAMASIPAGSPDAFGAIYPAEPPAIAAPVPQSWLRLSLDRSQGSRFYALWHISDGDRLQARRAGGDILAVRLYDVTGHPTQTPLPPPVEEQRCHDDFAQDWYLAVPRWDRIYLAEVGYLSSTGQWQAVARSSEVSAISPQ